MALVLQTVSSLVEKLIPKENTSQNKCQLRLMGCKMSSLHLIEAGYISDISSVNKWRPPLKQSYVKNTNLIKAARDNLDYNSRIMLTKPNVSLDKG